MIEQEDAKRIALAEMVSNPQEGITLTQRDYQFVKSVPITMDVLVGSMEITLEKLFSLKAGEVLSLDKEVDEPIQLILDGNIIAEGNLVAVNGAFGIEISRVSE